MRRDIEDYMSRQGVDFSNQPSVIGNDGTIARWALPHVYGRAVEHASQRMQWTERTREISASQFTEMQRNGMPVVPAPADFNNPQWNNVGGMVPQFEEMSRHMKSGTETVMVKERNWAFMGLQAEQTRAQFTRGSVTFGSEALGMINQTNPIAYQTLQEADRQGRFYKQ